MLEVTVSMQVKWPSYEVRSETIKLNGADKLTPKTARMAAQYSSFAGYPVTVWWTDFDHEAGEPRDSYGYRLYKNSARKIYPEMV